jgi:hypothetical protein
VRILAKSLIAIVLVLVVVFVVVGPGRAVAGAEYPFGIGPWSSNGHYCQDIYDIGHFADEWHHSDQRTLTPKEKVSVVAFEKTLTESGPVVPRTDFVAFFRTSGNVVKTMTSEGALINTWSNQNCTDPLIEAPSTLNSVWSGLLSHESFTHYPKNVIKVENFFGRAITG